MSDSLLPDNRSPLQLPSKKAVDQVLAQREALLPDSLFDAMTVPRQYPVARAIETGVADWSPTDSEQMQRMTTRDAIPLNCSPFAPAPVFGRACRRLAMTPGSYRVRPFVIASRPRLNRRHHPRVASA